MKLASRRLCVKVRHSGLAVAMLGSLLGFGGQGHAQAQQAAPPTREELDIRQRLGDQATAPNRVVVEGDIERGPCPLAAPAVSGTIVNFSHVTFANLSAVPPETLDATWTSLAGRDVPVSSLCEIRDRAATALRRLGYLAAVQIPPQRIENAGDVRMDVLVARLVEVQVRGNAGPNEGLIAAHLAKLTKQEWFNIKVAERHLLLLSDLPGIDAKLTLRPAKTGRGDVVGDLLVKRRPLELVVGAQNLGSRSTGRGGAFAQFSLNGVTGLGDRTVLSLFNTLDTEEQTVVQLTHDFAIGADGLRLGGSLLYGRGEPSFTTADFRTETVIGRLELAYPAIRRRSFTLYATGGLEWVDQSVDLGSIPLTEDRLRVAFARLTVNAVDKGSLTGRGGYSASEPKWQVSAALEVRQGIGALGASADCSPVANCLSPRVPISNFLADPSAFVVRAQALLEYRPIPEVTVAAVPRLQYSPDALLGFEQYSLGNYTIGRGLDPGVVLGDSGAGSSLEFRYGRLTPRDAESIALQPFAFFDAAWAWSHDDGLTDDPLHVYSAGGGVRMRWGSHMDATFQVAAPLRRAGQQARRGDVRALFTVRARLMPWKPS